MAISTFDVDVENISALSDQPNDGDGLSSQELKALFDKAGVDIKAFINETLIPEINEAIAAAARGIAVDDISGEIISDGSIASSKLSSEEGFEAVITGVIRNYAVTLEKLSLPVQTILTELQTNVSNLLEQIDTKASASSLATVATTGNYSDLSGKPTIPVVDTTLNVSSGNAITNAAVTAGLNAKQAAKVTTTVTLSSGVKAWNNVTVTGATASNTIIVSPAPSSYAQWVDNRVRATAQSADKMSFAADTNTSASITVNVLILN